MRTIYIAALLIFCFFCSNSDADIGGDDTHRQANAATSAQLAEAEPIILDEKTQKLAGIETRKLEAVAKQPEFIAYGTVLSLEPLLQLRKQYMAAQAQQDIAKAKYSEAHFNLSRTQSLHQQEIVSTRRLQEQLAQSQADQANLQASNDQQQAILAFSRLEWGDLLTDLFVSQKKPGAEAFLSHHDRLLQINLPANGRLNSNVHDIFIDERGQRNSAVKAILIAKSPKIDPVLQGERFFFKSVGRPLPFGAHITAWIANDSAQKIGVNIPKSAVVWHMGQAYVFIKTAMDRFVRRAISESFPENEVFFVAESVQADEEIVTIGAQTLLSQQLKALIPSEDKD